MEIQLWKDILNPYELAVEELLVKFNHLIKEYQDRGMYSPMEQVCGRVKSISSILDKAQKKNIEVDKIEEQLDDIAGIRIICQFVEDIEKVADLIRNRSDMQVVTEKDYINHMKSSGYRSYHMIVSYPASSSAWRRAGTTASASARASSARARAICRRAATVRKAS